MNIDEMQTEIIEHLSFMILTSQSQLEQEILSDLRCKFIYDFGFDEEMDEQAWNDAERRIP